MAGMRDRVRALLSVAEGDGGVVAAAPPVPVREIVRRFWPYARPYRRWLWLTALFIVILPAIETATIWLFKVVVDGSFREVALWEIDENPNTDATLNLKAEPWADRRPSLG